MHAGRTVRRSRGGRGVGGRRDGEPAQRGRHDARAAARSGTTRLTLGRLHPHAGRPAVPDRQPLLRLGLPLRPRTRDGRAPGLPRTRQGARRLVVDQRHDLPARQPDGLRPLGRGAWHGGVGLRPLPALLQEDGDLHRRRRRLPRRRRPADPGTRAGHEPAVRRLLRGRSTGGLRTDRRRQRLPPGGLRALRPQHLARPTLVGQQGLPAPHPRPTEPDGSHARLRRTRPVRREARDGRRVPAPGRRPPGRCGRRDPVWGRHRQPTAAAALGRGPRGAPAVPRDRRGGRPARRGPEPPGPPRGLHPVRLEEARVDGAVPRQVAPPLGGRGVALPPARSGRHQPLRGRWLRALQRDRRLAQPDVPLPAPGDPLRRLLAGVGSRLPGARGSDVLGRPRRAEDHFDRPAPAPVAPLQLPLDAQRPAGVARGGAHRPPHPHAAGVRRLQRG